MAEISYATVLSAGGRVARVLSPAIHQSLYDPVGLRSLMTYQPFSANGSATTNVTRVTRGAVAAATSTEVSGGFSQTVPTTTNYDIVVARYGLVMAPTDLFRMTADGGYDVAYLLGMLMEALDLTLTDLLCALFANIAGSVGSSGVDMTVDDFFDAMYYLNLKNNGTDVATVLHGQQVNDLIESVRGETGALQWSTEAQGLLRMPGVGFKGQLLGIPVYQSDSVTGDGSNRTGCMFAGGAFSYQLGDVSVLDPQINPEDVLFYTPEMFIERDRDAPNAITQYILNFYPGTAEAEDLRACRIVTDQ
jgi:hypothetical protein